MKIAIGTGNELKAKAIEKAMRSAYPEAEFVKVDVESGISENPSGKEEGMRGALNRAKRARDKVGADMGVGPEGITEGTAFGTFLYGWVAIADSDGKVGFGASAQVMLPVAMEKLMWKKMGIAESLSKISGAPKESIRFERGSNGILTKGMYHRKHEFEDATLCALARFVSPELYEEKK